MLARVRGRKGGRWLKELGDERLAQVDDGRRRRPSPGRGSATVSLGGWQLRDAGIERLWPWLSWMVEGRVTGSIGDVSPDFKATRMSGSIARAMLVPGRQGPRVTTFSQVGCSNLGV